MNVYLVCFEPDNRDELESLLASSGHHVVVATAALDDDLPGLREHPPELGVVILEAEPEHAIRRATELRTKRKFRTTPLLFGGGAADDLTYAESQFPAASFTRIDALLTAMASVRG